MSILSHKHYKRIDINPILTSVIMNVLFTKRLHSYFSKEDKRLNNPSRSMKKALSPYESPTQKITSNLFLATLISTRRNKMRYFLGYVRSGFRIEIKLDQIKAIIKIMKTRKRILANGYFQMNTRK